MARVAWIGLGVMGYPMAGHIRKKGGHDLTVYNRNAAKAEAWVKEHGGRTAATPAAAADGAEFDNNYDGGEPFTFVLGAGSVIQGWDQGLIGSKQDGRRQLDIPADLAYGDSPQGGVIQAGENEAAGVEQMKFFEVAPNLAMTQHAITIRPLCFSAKTFKSLPADLQAAILRAGKEAGAYGREIESSEDEQKLVALEKAGKLKRVPFADRAQLESRLRQLVD